jgi:hypothetical protein
MTPAFNIDPTTVMLYEESTGVVHAKAKS